MRQGWNSRLTRPPNPAPSQHGKYCLATNGLASDTATSEDCLFLDVYAPSNATAHSKLPVFLFIQGGGFNVNGNPNLNGTGLVTASGNNIIVVTINYRVGLYGFLTDGDNIAPNNGLFDQRKAMEWVQKYITQFGGVCNYPFREREVKNPLYLETQSERDMPNVL